MNANEAENQEIDRFSDQEKIDFIVDITGFFKNNYFVTNISAHAIVEALRKKYFNVSDFKWSDYFFDSKNNKFEMKKLVLNCVKEGQKIVFHSLPEKIDHEFVSFMWEVIDEINRNWEHWKFSDNFTTPPESKYLFLINNQEKEKLYDEVKSKFIFKWSLPPGNRQSHFEKLEKIMQELS